MLSVSNKIKKMYSDLAGDYLHKTSKGKGFKWINIPKQEYSSGTRKGTSVVQMFSQGVGVGWGL